MKIGHTIHFFDRISSTNDYLSNLSSKIDPIHGHVAIADYQSAGRGQFGRRWMAEPLEGLLMSVAVSPDDLRFDRVGQLLFFVSLSMKMYLEQLGINNVEIKWPNDILVDRKKIAGILVQNKFSRKNIRHSIIGIGVNVRQQSFTDAYSLTPTSLFRENALFTDRDKLVDLLLEILNEWYYYLRSGVDIKSIYFENLLGVAAPIHYFDILRNTYFWGQISDVLGDGRLIIKDIGDGALRAYNSGDIKWVQ